jgi:Tfp pilus assembly protein PilF
MKRLLRFCAVAAMAALPAFGAGSGSAGSSSDQPVVKAESPAVTVYNQGVDLMNAKQFTQAQGKVEQAVKLDPEFAEAYNNLAFTLRKQGSANFQKSLAYYNKAIQQSDPTQAETGRGVHVSRRSLHPNGTQG